MTLRPEIGEEIVWCELATRSGVLRDYFGVGLDDLTFETLAGDTRCYGGHHGFRRSPGA